MWNAFLGKRLPCAGWRVIALGALLPSLAACREPASGEFESWAVVVYGTVTDASGTPRQGVSLEFELYEPTCADGAWAGDGGPAFTGASGRYHHQLRSFRGVTPQCVRVFIRHSGQTRELAGEASGFRLERERNNHVPYDSVRVDVTIP